MSWPLAGIIRLGHDTVRNFRHKRKILRESAFDLPDGRATAPRQVPTSLETGSWLQVPVEQSRPSSLTPF